MVKLKPGRPSNNDNRRNEILQKATECFTMNGYNSTTLDEIGESLGFNKAALYYYFKNKEDLFSHVINFEMNRLWGKTVRETESVVGVENKMIKYFEVRCDISVGLIKATNLSKTNLINLNNPYSEANESFKKKQFDFLTGILTEANTNHSEEEIRNFLILLTSVQSSITMNMLLLRDSGPNKAMIEELKKTKTMALKYFLNSFLNGYNPTY